MDFQIAAWYFKGMSTIWKSKIRLVGYVDSDYAGGLDKTRSLTGYVFTIGGCAVSWRKQVCKLLLLYLPLK
jgi:hypothetical protein